MSSEVAISVRELTKSYPVSPSPIGRLIDFLLPNRGHSGVVRALNNVSFDIYRGETVGVVGRNGSGKSTLLSIIVGTLFETSGVVEKRGIVTGLLEVGSAFDGEFTGRENAELYGAVLGKSKKEIDAQIEQIIEFSEIGDFISQPVRTYSSGMKLRLAFSTAIMVDPDILVIDEALAVGDQAFQEKCYERLKEIRDRGATILFVSHGKGAIADLCDRALLLDEGELLLEDEPNAVMSEYSRLVKAPQQQKKQIREEIQALKAGNRSASPDQSSNPVPVEPGTQTPAPARGTSQGNGKKVGERWGTLSNVHIEDGDGSPATELSTGESYEFCANVALEKPIDTISVAVSIATKGGIRLGGFTSDAPKEQAGSFSAGNDLIIRIRFTCHLVPGPYVLSTRVRGLSEASSLPPADLSHHSMLSVVGNSACSAQDLIDFGFESAITTSGNDDT